MAAPNPRHGHASIDARHSLKRTEKYVAKNHVTNGQRTAFRLL